MAKQMEKAKPDHTHGEHRKRMREKFHKDGNSAAKLHDHELLEMLLYYVNPRGNTNPQAHLLLKEFHDLKGVLNTPYESLLRIEGIGEKAAIFLKLCHEFFVRVEKEKEAWQKETKRVTCRKDAVDLFISHYKQWGQEHRNEEVVMLACLDNQGRVLTVERFPSGQVNASSLDVRGIVSKAIGWNAAAVILAHNHPHGLPTPSQADIAATRTLLSTLRNLKIDLFDHVIIGEHYEGGSLMESGAMDLFGSRRSG